MMADQPGKLVRTRAPYAHEQASEAISPFLEKLIAALSDPRNDSLNFIPALGMAGAFRKLLRGPRGFHAEKFRTSIPVKTSFSGPFAQTFYDEIKGLNAGHALWRGRQNWPGATVSQIGSPAPPLEDVLKLLERR